LTYRTVNTVICPSSWQLGLRKSAGISAKHRTYFCLEGEESEPLRVWHVLLLSGRETELCCVVDDTALSVSAKAWHFKLLLSGHYPCA